MSQSNVTLVTGCSSGFGFIAAKDLSRRGHVVYASMRAVEGKNKEPAEALRACASEESLQLYTLDLDVTSDDSVASAVGQVIDEQGRVDVVVNNAGVMPLGVTEAFTVDQFRDNLEVNLLGVFRLVREVTPHMRTQGQGLVVNVSTVVGRIALPFFGIYQAGKWGLEALSESLRYELSESGIDVVIVEPGPFSTDLVGNSPSPGDSARLAQNVKLNNTFLAMMADFKGNVFENPEAPVDPQILVDTMIELIEMDAGKRPVRTVAGLDFGVKEINRLTDPFRRQALGGMGLEHLESVATAGDSRG
jgi:NAD(P)-dependent dehydrogenase (short-subunit alcohol dehydrogenase family)